MAYVKNFKGFLKTEDTPVTDIKVGANPQMIEEEDASILTDPALITLREQKRNLEKQLEQIRQQEDVKLKELTAKAATELKAKQAAQNAAVNQPSTPTT